MRLSILTVLDSVAPSIDDLGTNFKALNTKFMSFYNFIIYFVFIFKIVNVLLNFKSGESFMKRPVCIFF